MEENLKTGGEAIVESNDADSKLKKLFTIGFIAALVGIAIYAVIIAVGLLVWGRVFLFGGYAFTKVFAIIGLLLMIGGIGCIVAEFIVQNIAKRYDYHDKKKLIKTIVAVVLSLVFIIVGIVDAGASAKNAPKPTATFTALSNYIEKKNQSTGASKYIEYKNVSDTSFGSGSIKSIKVYSYKNSISFWFYVNSNLSCWIDIYNYSQGYISILYKETTYSVETTVDMEYSTLRSSTSAKVVSVKVADVKQAETSNLYSSAVSNAKKAVDKAIPWMSAVVQQTLNNSTLTVHDLYN